MQNPFQVKLHPELVRVRNEKMPEMSMQRRIGQVSKFRQFISGEKRIADVLRNVALRVRAGYVYDWFHGNPFLNERPAEPIRRGCVSSFMARLFHAYIIRFPVSDVCENCVNNNCYFSGGVQSGVTPIRRN
jgi:hypothetical protein